MPTIRNRLEWNATVKAYPAVCDPYAFKEPYLEEKLINTSGDYNMDFSAVDTGEVWIVQAVTCVSSGAACDNLIHYIVKNADEYPFNAKVTVPTGEYLISQVMLILPEGAFIRCYFDNIAAVSWCAGSAVGWKVATY